MTDSLLSRARTGDEQAFGELVGPHRRELHLHCYRMLGSFTDAEDALQETLLAAWRSLGGFEGRASLRAWLYRIATNRCLNVRRDAGRRLPPAPTPPFDPPEPTRWGEITWLQPYPDALLDPETRYEAKESVGLAFITGLQRLPPRQTAVLILRDVLGFDTAEVARMLDTTGTAVKGALQRARASLDSRPEPAALSADEEELARRFAEAFTARDVDTVIALLTDDAWLAMPPAPHEYQGADAIAAFLKISGEAQGSRRLLLTPVGANAQPAFACRLAEPGDPVGSPAGLMVLTLRAGQIAGLTRFHDNAALTRAGLM
ncbi:RNA polymerase subunit sigma-70 [Actinoplanes friuliensis]|uniref:RNA polymerase subunit sigma-70 n=1 Tax=Actinoplanes friuliensis TaxID=196914 RepID=UPI001930B392|nr:RNA polymerase subunit sigma-70 [Actinoplanes friuliensis]